MIRSLCALLLTAALLPAGQSYLVTTLIGNNPGPGTDGPALEATFAAVSDLTLDTDGNLYIVDSGRIRRVSPDGMIHTIAGTGKYESTGDGGPAVQAGIWPQTLIVDTDGTIYFAEPIFHRVRRITPDGYIHTVAGTGVAGGSGLNGPATSLQLHGPSSVAADSAHNLYIADPGNRRIIKVSPEGTATEFATDVIVQSITIGSDGALYSGQMGDGLTRWDSQGNITEHFGDFDSSLLKAGPGGVIYDYSYFLRQLYRLDPGSQTPVLVPVGTIDAFAVAIDGTLYTCANGIVVKVGASGNTPVAGAAGSTFGARNFALDGAGLVYTGGNPVRKINLATGDVTVVAGTGVSGYSGDGGPAVNATLSYAGPITVSPLGEVYFGDGTRVRKVDRAGIITTVAGIDAYGYNGDNIPATQAALYGLGGIALSPAGELYLSDNANHRIRRVDGRGIITTVVGNGIIGPSGDGGPAAAAELAYPGAILFDSTGNLYIADQGGTQVRMVTPGGTISTIGKGSSGYWAGMDRDAVGNFYLTGQYPCAIWKISPAGVVEQIAGAGPCGLLGDAGPALSAQLLAPADIRVAADGTLLFADGGRYLRKLEPANIFPLTVVNAGSWLNNPLAPGELVTLYWTGLATPPATTATVVDGRFPATLADTQVLFDGAAAPMLYVDSQQINTVVPYAVAGRAATAIQVVSGGKQSNTIGMPVQPVSPGLFAIVNADYSRNGPQAPAARGGVVVLFGTGGGQATPAGDGLVTPGAGSLGAAVTARIDGLPAVVDYAGPAPGLISGVFQINIRIPEAAHSGSVPLTLVIGQTPAESGIQVVVQ